MVATLVLALLAQDTVGDLIEKLGAESLDDREEAVRRLKQIGKPALPELEKAAKGADVETATRAQYLLRLIPILGRVTPHLLQVMPGLELRLSVDDPHSWTMVLLEAMELKVRRHIENGDELFEPGDLEALAPLGLRGAATKQEKEWACSAVVHLKLGSAGPEVAKFLDDPIADVRACALETLKTLRSPLVLPAYRRALRDPDPNAQARACESLADLRDGSSIPEIAQVLKSESAFARGHAAWALARLGSVEHAGRIGELLEHKDPTARFYAIRAVVELASCDEAGRVRALLRDPDPSVRAAAVRALEIVQGRGAVPALRGMRDDPIPLVQGAVTATLCHLGAPDRVPLFLEGDGRLELLNGVRQPEAWSRLRSVRIKEPIEGTIAELRSWAEKQAGMNIEWPMPAPGQEKWISSSIRIARGRDPLLLPDTLPDLLASPRAMIVEPDRIRFIPADDAKKFWSTWWADEQKRK